MQYCAPKTVRSPCCTRPQRHGVIDLISILLYCFKRHLIGLEKLWRRNFNCCGILSGSKSYGAETLIVARKSKDDQGDPQEETTSYGRDPSWSDEIAEFANAIINDKPIEHGSSDDALKTMQLVYKIYCADPAWKDQWSLDNSLPE